VKIFECPREIFVRVASGLHRNEILKVKTGRGGCGDSYGGGAMTNRRLNSGAMKTCAWLQWTKMTRVESAFGTGRVGCRSERQSRSGGFPTELRRRTATDGDGQREMLFDSVG